MARLRLDWKAADSVASCSALRGRSRLILHLYEHLDDVGSSLPVQIRVAEKTGDNQVERDDRLAALRSTSATHDAGGSHEHTGVRVPDAVLFLGARRGFGGLSDLAVARGSSADKTPSLAEDQCQNRIALAG